MGAAESCALLLCCSEKGGAVGAPAVASSGAKNVDSLEENSQGRNRNRARETGLGEAVWFGCLTGGLDGTIVSFDAEVIRLAPISGKTPSL